MKSFLKTTLAILALSVYVTDTCAQQNRNLLESCVASDESMFYDTDTFYQKWECVWKDGEKVPQKSRPVSIYSSISKNQYGNSQVTYPRPGTAATANDCAKAGLEPDTPVAVLDFPYDNEYQDLYYRIPIRVNVAGEYRLTGSIYMAPYNNKGSYVKVNNFATDNYLSVFAAEDAPCKKVMKINSEYQLVTTSSYGDHSCTFQSFYKIEPINKTITLSPEDKYLCVYAPPAHKTNNGNYSTGAVAVLGNLRLEAAVPGIDPEPGISAEVLTFSSHSVCLRQNEIYTLEELGLTSPSGFDWAHADLEISLENNQKSDTENYFYVVTDVDGTPTVEAYASHDYSGYPAPLPYTTLTVMCDIGNGQTAAASVKLYTINERESTAARFDYSKSSCLIEVDENTGFESTPSAAPSCLSDSGDRTTNSIITTSDYGSWEISMGRYDISSNGEYPKCEYIEATGWKIDFGEELRKYRLSLTSNMTESHYIGNPAYVMDRMSITVDASGARQLKISDEESSEGIMFTKELRQLTDGDDSNRIYILPDAASLSKSICVEASGTVTIKEVALGFNCNFDIPAPRFMNVNNENATTIFFESPTDSSGNSFWDVTALPIEYRIDLVDTEISDEPDMPALLAGTPNDHDSETETATEPATDGHGGWNEYIPGDKITFNDGEKLTARTVHPHGMVSHNNYINYSVITGIEDAHTESETGRTEYYSLQGIPLKKPSAEGLYIKVINGKPSIMKGNGFGTQR